MSNAITNTVKLFETHQMPHGQVAPVGYVVGLGREYPHPKTAHLYKGSFEDPDRPMCKRGYNRGSGYSIWRNCAGAYSVCRICMRRALANLEPIDWPEDEPHVATKPLSADGQE